MKTVKKATIGARSKSLVPPIANTKTERSRNELGLHDASKTLLNPPSYMQSKNSLLSRCPSENPNEPIFSQNQATIPKQHLPKMKNPSVHGPAVGLKQE